MAVRKINGVLEEVADASITPPAPGELPNGQPVGSADPLSALAAGASPDSAKMASTPQAQIGLAAKITTAAKDTVEGAKRLKAPKAVEAITPEEQQFNDRLQKLGGLGGRIQTLVDKQLESAVQAPANIEVDPAYVTSLPKAQQEPYKAGVTRLNAALISGNSSAINSIMAELNTTFKDPEIYNTLSVDVATVISSAIAKGVVDPEQVNIKLLMSSGVMRPEDLGLSEDELSKTLGTNWLDMTPAQVGMALRRHQALNSNDVATLHAQLDNPMLTPSAREDIKDKLWDMGYSGKIQREADAEVLAKQVETSGKVRIGGELVDINDALSDTNLTGIFGDYLRGDDAFKAKFTKANPSLAAWLDKNKEQLTGALETVKATDASLGEIKKKNDALFQFDTGSEIGAMTPEVIKAIFPDWEPGKFMTEGMTSGNKLWEHLQGLKNGSPASRKEAGVIVDTLNSLSKSNPALAKEAFELAQTDPAAFNRLVHGLKDPATKDAARLSNPPPLTKDTTAESMIDWLFGEDSSVESVQTQLEALKKDSPFNQDARAAYDSLANIFDLNRDGAMDEINSIHMRATGYATKGGLNSVLGGMKAGTKNVLANVDKKITLDPAAAGMSAMFSKYLDSPNDKVSAREMNIVLSAPNMTIENVSDIIGSGVGLHPDARSAVGRKLHAMLPDSDYFKAVKQVDPGAMTLITAKTNMDPDTAKRAVKVESILRDQIKAAPPAIANILRNYADRLRLRLEQMVDTSFPKDPPAISTLAVNIPPPKNPPGGPSTVKVSQSTVKVSQSTATAPDRAGDINIG